VDVRLASRLAEVGLDPDAFGDSREAFARLHARYGKRVTLVDRYALEAAALGIRTDDLDPPLRASLAHEVLPLQYPGWELAAGSERTVPDPIEVVPYTPEWATAFAGWKRRLESCLQQSGASTEHDPPTSVRLSTTPPMPHAGTGLQQTVARIEHVGSTAVPGLAAKPVIDVLVSVVDVEDEASYVPAIESAEVALRSRELGHRYFRPVDDRPRDIQIHVCETGGSWEREHLLFRDFLRADAATRDAYARLKLDLAERYRDDRLAYNEAKTGFVLDALVAAEEWAAQTGWTVSSAG
jgi:GrpB-like predicted nucleotidyltransferase (UPF0157 family)